MPAGPRVVVAELGPAAAHYIDTSGVLRHGGVRPCSKIRIIMNSAHRMTERAVEVSARSWTKVASDLELPNDTIEVVPVRALLLRICCIWRGRTTTARSLMQPRLASTVQIAATLHSDSHQPRRRESRFAYLIGNVAQRAAATGGGCAVQTLPSQR